MDERTGAGADSPACALLHRQRVPQRPTRAIQIGLVRAQAWRLRLALERPAPSRARYEAVLGPPDSADEKQASGAQRRRARAKRIAAQWIRDERAALIESPSG